MYCHTQWIFHVSSQVILTIALWVTEITVSILQMWRLRLKEIVTCPTRSLWSHITHCLLPVCVSYYCLSPFSLVQSSLERQYFSFNLCVTTVEVIYWHSHCGGSLACIYWNLKFSNSITQQSHFLCPKKKYSQNWTRSYVQGSWLKHYDNGNLITTQMFTDWGMTNKTENYGIYT